ncbi:MAG: PDZ domain-containing protein [Luteolibacter sp.]
MSITGSISYAGAEPSPIPIKYLPTASNAVAVTAPDSRFVVSVYTDSAPLTKGLTTANGKNTALQFAGQDTTTRLCFFQNPNSNSSSAVSWSERFGKDAPVDLQAITTAGTDFCRYDKWVTQVGAKVLPLGLLSITFTGEVPPPGTPLVDSNGKIVGLILQKVSNRTAYALPAQAVRRVQRDIENHRKLVRGWLGISLSTESTVPRITHVWPDSPAYKAGLNEGDILVSASGYPTARYPDAVNALFYAVPGQPTSVQVSRKNQRISCEITPMRQKPGE